MTVDYKFSSYPVKCAIVSVSDGTGTLSMSYPLGRVSVADWKPFEKSGFANVDTFIATQEFLGEKLSAIAATLSNMLGVLGKTFKSIETQTGFAEYFKTYIDKEETEGCSEKRIDKFKISLAYLKSYLESLGMEDISLDKVDRDFIDGFYDFLLARNIKNTTVGTYLRFLRPIYNAAVREGLVMDAKPFDDSMINPRNMKPEASENDLTEQDIKKLKEADFSDDAEQAEVRELLIAAYETGLGLNELINLKPGCIKEDGIWTGKTILPISPDLRKFLLRDPQAEYCFYDNREPGRFSNDRDKLFNHFRYKLLKMSQMLDMKPRLNIMNARRLNKLNSRNE